MCHRQNVTLPTTTARLFAFVTRKGRNNSSPRGGDRNRAFRRWRSAGRAPNGTVEQRRRGWQPRHIKVFHRLARGGSVCAREGLDQIGNDNAAERRLRSFAADRPPPRTPASALPSRSTARRAHPVLTLGAQRRFWLEPLQRVRLRGLRSSCWHTLLCQLTSAATTAVSAAVIWASRCANAEATVRSSGAAAG